MSTDDIERSIQAAADAAERLEVRSEEIVEWLSVNVAPVQLEPGVTNFPGSEDAMERYLRFRRDQAFLEHYFSAADGNSPFVLWWIVPNGVNADPGEGTHNLATLTASDLRPAHRLALGDAAIIDLTEFAGREGEVMPIIRLVSEAGSMIRVIQVAISNGRIDPNWFRQELGYVSAVPDGDLYRPMFRDGDS